MIHSALEEHETHAARSALRDAGNLVFESVHFRKVDIVDNIQGKIDRQAEIEYLSECGEPLYIRLMIAFRNFDDDDSNNNNTRDSMN